MNKDLMIRQQQELIEQEAQKVETQAYELIEHYITETCNRYKWDFVNLAWTITAYKRGTKQEVENPTVEKLKKAIFWMRDVCGRDMSDFIYRDGVWIG